MQPASTEELMVCRIALEVDDSGVTVLGSFTPLAYASYMLAKLTRAPDAFLIGFNGLDIPAIELNMMSVEAEIYRFAAARWSFLHTTNTVHMGGRGLLECISPAQIDGSGAFNTSVIGDYDHPKVRLPGGAGSPEVIQNYQKVVVYVSRHDRRTLVDHVDFVSGQRIPLPDGQGAKRRSSDGAILLVTPMAVLLKASSDSPFRLESLHEDITVSDVLQNCGFPIEVPSEDIPPTAMPTDTQLTLLRERIDPFGTIRFDFMGATDRAGYVRDIVATEWSRARRALGLPDET
jgi:acyl CoA:acetate/3-ketoacid CoA transferase beta subunit